MDNFPDLTAKLRAVKADYAATLPEKIEQIEQTWNRLSRGKWNHDDIEALDRMMHSLTGSGKTFGFDLLSDSARRLEHYLKQFVQEKKVPNNEQRGHIRLLLSEVKQVAIPGSASSHPEGPGLVQRMTNAAKILAQDESTSSRFWTPVSAPRIFIVENEPTLAELLTVQLRYFGYEVSVFSTLAEFRLAMKSQSDVLVLMDVTFPESRDGGIDAMKEIQQGRHVPVPVIFVAAHDEFATRLEAVRAGGIAFLSKPVNIDNLLNKLDAMSSPLSPIPYRILIVDDSEPLLVYYAEVLERAGMVVKAVSNPLEVMPILHEFTPDLILLDIYMPGCNGMELAKIFGQLDILAGVPIVFLSAESDLERQLFAMGMGADDYLVKPIEPQHLVSSVSSRVQRGIKLRSFMVRDSLTGLLNHTAITEQLARAVAQTKRRGAPMSLAMIDIDNFRSVNDTYGHAVGDQVIKCLARLLKQRLRETDLIGRHGGEEFAVILSHTDATAAAKVVDVIRNDFSHVRHLANGTEFFVTFSCGIADCRDFNDLLTLGDAAEKALGRAKQRGRNRIMLAEKRLA